MTDEAIDAACTAAQDAIERARAELESASERIGALADARQSVDDEVSDIRDERDELEHERDALRRDNVTLLDAVKDLAELAYGVDPMAVERLLVTLRCTTALEDDAMSGLDGELGLFAARLRTGAQLASRPVSTVVQFRNRGRRSKGQRNLPL